MKFLSLFGIAAVAMLCSCESHRSRRLEDVGFGEYFSRYNEIVRKTRVNLDATCSTNLMPALAAGSQARPENLGFALAIGNNARLPILIPACAVGQMFPSLTFFRDGKKMKYRGPCSSLSQAEQSMITIPPKAEFAFYLGIPISHELSREIPVGHYRVEWPFHKEAFAEFTIDAGGKILFNETAL